MDVAANGCVRVSYIWMYLTTHTQMVVSSGGTHLQFVHEFQHSSFSLSFLFLLIHLYKKFT